jgi:hypothetical protein
MVDVVKECQLNWYSIGEYAKRANYENQESEKCSNLQISQNQF